MQGDEIVSDGLRKPFEKGFLKNLSKTFTGQFPAKYFPGELPHCKFQEGIHKKSFLQIEIFLNP